MKHDPEKRRARRGLTIMAGLFLAAMLIFNMDVFVDWFRGYIDVVAVVLETNGVRVGSRVAVEGMEAGHVTAIDFMELGGRGAIALHVRLDDRVRPAVRIDSRSYTARRNLIGEPMVQISAGPPGSPPLETGDTIYPSERPSLDTLMARRKSFAPTLDSLATALVSLELIVEERRPELDAVVGHLTLAADEAATLRAALDDGAIRQWLDDPTLGRRVERLKVRMADLSEAAAGIERYGDPELRVGVAVLRERADRVGLALTDLERRIGEGGGVFTRMGRDSALAVAMAGVQAQIDSLSAAGLGFALRMFLP